MTAETVRLCDLKRGERAHVRSLDAASHIRRRLQDIGLEEGAAVECVMVSPLGDPTAYLICGAVIALRREDAACVQVRYDMFGRAAI